MGLVCVCGSGDHHCLIVYVANPMNIFSGACVPNTYVLIRM